MIASDRRMMSSMRSSACGFSILATRPARSPIRPLASSTSDGFWTNDSATQSTPSDRPNSRSARSFFVSGDTSSAVPGRLTPLRLEMTPPTTAFASMKSSPTPVTRTRTRPSSISRSWPGAMAAKISGCGSGIACLPPSPPVSTKRIVSPVATSILPSRIAPTRIFGPCRSIRMPIGRPVFPSSARIAAWTLA